MIGRLLRLVPPHREYVEPYFGSGALFFAKEPALVETINDIDHAVMEFFRVLRDYPQEFIELARLTIHSRELFEECRAKWREETDPVRKAWRWWVVARQSFSGNWGAGWRSNITLSRRGMAMSCSALLSAVEHLPDCVERLKRTQIECGPAIKVMQQYCTPNSFCYCDPPYIPDTRRSSTVYDHEMSVEEHKELVEVLLSLPGRFMLSGYNHEVYKPLEEAGWVRIDFPTGCYAAARSRRTGLLGDGTVLEKQARVESVWLDPETAKLVRAQTQLIGEEA